jgi:hypothetical protein
MGREHPRKVISVLLLEREEWFIEAVSEVLHLALKVVQDVPCRLSGGTQSTDGQHQSLDLGF